MKGPRGFAIGVAALIAALALQLLPAASASHPHSHDGLGNPLPFYPPGGMSVDIFSTQGGAQSFQASLSYALTQIYPLAMNKGASGNNASVQVRVDSWSNAPGDFEPRTFGYQESRLAVALRVDKATVRAEELLTHTLWFNKSTELANLVWINDTIPPGLIHISDDASAGGGSRTGNRNWTFIHVAGTHYFLLIPFPNTGLAYGTLLINRSDPDYTDFRGPPQSRPTAAVTDITLPGPLAGSLPRILLTIAAAAGLRHLFLPWPRGKVEEALLVDYGGTLVAHFSRTVKPDKDRQLVAAMLTAVQAFIRDAFATAKEGELRHMDFGERKLFIRRGREAYLAVVVRGRSPVGLPRKMTKSLATIEATYGEVLARWSGNMADVAGADEMLSKGLFGGGPRGLLRRLFGGRSVR